MRTRPSRAVLQSLRARPGHGPQAEATRPALQVERLEERDLLAVWQGDVNNLWSEAGNWDTNNVPDAVGENAVFDNTGVIRGIDLGGGSYTIDFIRFNQTGGGAYSLSNGTFIDLPLIEQFGTINTNTLAASITIQNAGNLTVDANHANNATTVLMAGILDVDGTITKNGNRTFQVTGDNSATFSNQWNINNGEVRVTNSANLGDESATNLLNFGGGRLAVDSTFSTNRTVLGANPRFQVNGGNTLTLTTNLDLSAARNVGVDGGTVAWAGNLVGNQNFTKSGGGQLNLTADNSGTFTGLVIANAGTLRGTTSQNFGSGAGGNNFQVDNARLEFGGSFTTTRNVNVNSPLSQIDVDTGMVVTVSGVVSGNENNSLRKVDNGTLRFSGNNTFQGYIQIDAGTLVAASNNALGAAGAGSHPTIVRPGGTLALDGGVTVGETIILNGQGFGGGGALKNLAGTNTITSSVTLGSNASIASDAGNFIFSAASTILADFALTFDGAGDIEVNGVLGGRVGAVAGLQEGRFTSGGLDTGTATTGGLVTTSVRQGLTNSKGFLSGGNWNDNESWVYIGQIWDDDGYFQLAENIDDNVVIFIDGVLVLRNNTGTNPWQTVTTTASLDGRSSVDDALRAGVNNVGAGLTTNFGPGVGGWHTIEIRMFNGGGGAGPVVSGGAAVLASGWTALKGIGYRNTNAGNETTVTHDGDDYVPLDAAFGAANFRFITQNSVVKRGSGTLFLNNGGNTFEGVLDIYQGTVVVPANGALGATTAGTNVHFGGTLEIANTNYTNLEPLVLDGGTLRGSGTASWGQTGVPLPAITNFGWSFGMVIEAAAGANFTVHSNIEYAGGPLVVQGDGNTFLEGVISNVAPAALSPLSAQIYSTPGNTTLLVATASTTDDPNLVNLEASFTPVQTIALTTPLDFGEFTTTAGSPGLGGPMTRNSTTLNMFAGIGATTVGNDNYSTLAKGWLRVDVTGDYQFVTRSDDGSRIWLDVNHDGVLELLADRNILTGMGNTVGASVFLVAGYYQFMGGFFEAGGGAGWQAGWQRNSGATTLPLEVIPISNLTPGANDNSVYKRGLGTATFSGANTYTGSTFVEAGVLVINNATALGTTSAGTQVDAGAILELNNFAYTGEALTLNGGTLRATAGTTNGWAGTITLTDDSFIQVVDAAADMTISGAISGAAGNDLTKIGAGDLFLTANNTFAGEFHIVQGLVQLNAGGQLSGTANIFVGEGGNTAILVLNNNATHTLGTGVVTLGVGAGSNGTLRQLVGTVTTAGVVDGDGTSTLQVDGAQNVSATLNINGNLDVDNLRVAYTSTNGSAGADYIATVNVNGGLAAIGLDSPLTSEIFIGRTEVNTPNTDTRGTLNLAGATSVQISANRLRIGTMSDLPADVQNPAGVNNVPGTSGSTAGGTLTLSTAGTNTITANYFLIGDSPGAANAGPLSLVTLGGGTNNLNVGDLVVGGRKSRGTMTAIAGSVVNINGVGGAATTGNLRVGDNQTPTSTGIATTGIATFTGATLTANLDALIVGRHTLGTGSGTGTLTFDTGTISANTVSLGVTAVAGNNATGTINHNGGTLAFTTMTGGGAAGNSTRNYNWSGGTITHLAGGNFSVANVVITVLTGATHTIFVDAGRTGTFQATASLGGSAGSVAKTGTGDLFLLGPSTYSGIVNINAGTVYANNVTGSATGTATVSVNNSGTLAGVGFVTGPVNVQSGGTVNPGSPSTGTGVLTVTTINFLAGSNLDLLINGNTPAQIDKLTVAAGGAITIDAAANLNLSAPIVPTVDTYLLIENDSASALSAFAARPFESLVMIGGVAYSLKYVYDETTDSATGGNDLALLRRGVIGNFVWDDTNGDGLQNGGELGVAGVTVNLRRVSDNSLVFTTTTDANGLYSFAPEAGDYYLEFDHSTATGTWAFTLADQGGDDTIDSDALTIVNATTRRTANFTLGDRLDNGDLDAGLYVPASISGVKYDDTDDNGVGGADVGRSGDTIELYFDADGDGIFDETTPFDTEVSGAGGAFTFSALAPGRYYVQQVVPAGRMQTAPVAPLFYTFVVDSGDVLTGADFYDFNPAPVADAGTSYTITEGDTLNLVGTGSTDDFGGTIVSYAWDVDGDGQFDDAVGSTASLTWAQLIALSIPVNDNTTTSRTISLLVTDNEGKTHVATATLDVLNRAPAITGLAVNTVINENDTVTLSFNIDEPGPLDNFTLSIVWGDGSVENFNLPAGTTSFSRTHQYLDDNPTGTLSDVYNLVVTLTDKDSDFDEVITPITVNNVNPTAAIQTTGLIVPGQGVTFTGVFSDVGTQDTHMVQWDFGDGTVTAFTPAAGSTVSPVHAYALPGQYTVRLTVLDDDGGSITVTRTIFVGLNGLGPDIGGSGQDAYYVGGTAGGDKVWIKYVNKSTIQIVVNGQNLGRFSDLGRVFVFGQGGNDKIRMDQRVTVALYAEGNEGNDTIEGGRGNDVILGGAGKDKLYGGMKGRDIIVGGSGKDILKGGSPSGRSVGNDEDVLVGGSLTYEGEIDRMFQLYATWNGGDAFASRVASLRSGPNGLDANVVDDFAKDKLFGGASSDWLWSGLRDTFDKDRKDVRN